MVVIKYYEANQALTKASYESVYHRLYLPNVLSCVIMNSRLGTSMISGFYILATIPSVKAEIFCISNLQTH